MNYNEKYRNPTPRPQDTSFEAWKVRRNEMDAVLMTGPDRRAAEEKIRKEEDERVLSKIREWRVGNQALVDAFRKEMEIIHGFSDLPETTRLVIHEDACKAAEEDTYNEYYHAYPAVVTKIRGIHDAALASHANI